MASIVELWKEHFQRYHPEVRFEIKLMGTDTGMAGLYGGVADIALLGRESNTTENDGFLHSLQYKPLQLRLLTGSLAAPGKSFAPVFFVYKNNPLSGLTLDQIEQIIGCGESPQRKPIETWGDLGLSGYWKEKRVHLYMFDIESGTGAFLLRRLQGESKKLRWENIQEFRDARHPDGTAYDAAEQIIDALRKDPYGLGVSNLHYAVEDVKPLALAVNSDSPYIPASRKTVADGTYPLARATYAFVNAPPNQPASPLVKEFLRFVYSDEGQGLVKDDGGFLPLSSQEAMKQISLIP